MARLDHTYTLHRYHGMAAGVKSFGAFGMGGLGKLKKTLQRVDFQTTEYVPSKGGQYKLEPWNSSSIRAKVCQKEVKRPRSSDTGLLKPASTDKPCPGNPLPWKGHVHDQYPPMNRDYCHDNPHPLPPNPHCPLWNDLNLSQHHDPLSLSLSLAS